MAEHFFLYRRKKGERPSFTSSFFYTWRGKIGFFDRFLAALQLCVCIYYTPYLVLLSIEKNYILCFWRFEQKSIFVLSLLPKERNKRRKRGMPYKKKSLRKRHYERSSKRFIKNFQLSYKISIFIYYNYHASILIKETKMLKLKNIRKVYVTASERVEALRDV